MAERRLSGGQSGSAKRSWRVGSSLAMALMALGRTCERHPASQSARSRLCPSPSEPEPPSGSFSTIAAILVAVFVLDADFHPTPRPILVVIAPAVASCRFMFGCGTEGERID
jgi:hypothetical protein